MSSRQQSAISDAERVEESGEEGNDVGNGQSGSLRLRAAIPA